MSAGARWSAALLCGLVLAVMIGGVAGVVVGVLAAVTAGLVLRRVESPQVRRERAVARADLPFAAELLAAALRAGAPPDRAVLVVGEAMGGPVGLCLTRTGRSLRLGATPEAAWAHTAGLPGGRRFATAATRSAERGTALALVLDRQAADLRLARAAAVEAAVKRVGVLAVLPVGMCFLPAFVLVGVVPVVVAVLREVFVAL
ncbi:type II secretion system F family protein [Dactylosporangium roseum]|nr:type II secretion system F family protein [Dactylosporangium roseum]